METKKMSHECCSGGSRHKKAFIIFGGLLLLTLILLLIASVGWKVREARNRAGMMYGFGGDYGRGRMMNPGKGFYPTVQDVDNQFILPEDAAKSGELAITVSDLETAKKAVTEIASKSAGSVYATFIAYASNNLRNGSIVVQVPAENFEMTFEELKKVGSQVVQEKTLQVAPRNVYPVPMVAEEKTTQQPVANEQDETATAVPEEVKGDTVISRDFVRLQPVQSKGYIKVVFVDYGKNAGAYGERRGMMGAGSVISIGDPATKDIRNNLIVIIGIKIILLVAIVGLLLAMFKKIFHRIKRRKENSHKVHVVRQMSKTHKRVVRVQKKK